MDLLTILFPWACLLLQPTVVGGAITCFAPPAYLGEKSTLTCDFGVDVRDTKQVAEFNVRRSDYDFEYNRDTVLDCEWQWESLSVACSIIKASAGYSYDRRVTDHLTIVIDNVTEYHAGTYYCQLTPTDQPDDILPCNLSVTERTGPKPTVENVPTTTQSGQHAIPESKTDQPEAKSGGVNILYIIIPVIGVVLLVAVVVVVWMFKRRHVGGDEDHDDEEKGEAEEGGGADERPVKDTAKQPDGNSADLGTERETSPLLQDDSPETQLPDDDVFHKGDSEGARMVSHQANPEVVAPPPLFISEEVVAPDTSDAERSASPDSPSPAHSDDSDTSETEETRHTDDVAGCSRLTGDTPRTKRKKENFQPVVKEIDTLGASGESPLQSVPDQYKRASAQRGLQPTWPK